jgi:YVTN family beta-propeller protein
MIGYLERTRRVVALQAIAAGGKKRYFANGCSNAVFMIDTATLEKVKDNEVGETPWGVYIAESN